MRILWNTFCVPKLNELCLSSACTHSHFCFDDLHLSVEHESKLKCVARMEHRRDRLLFSFQRTSQRLTWLLARANPSRFFARQRTIIIIRCAYTFWTLLYDFLLSANNLLLRVARRISSLYHTHHAVALAKSNSFRYFTQFRLIQIEYEWVCVCVCLYSVYAMINFELFKCVAHKFNSAFVNAAYVCVRVWNVFLEDWLHFVIYSLSLLYFYVMLLYGYG